MRAQVAQRFGRRGLDRIFEGERPGQLAVDRHEDAALARGLSHQCPIADGDLVAADVAGHALAGDRPDVRRAADRYAPLPRRDDDGRGQRMLAGALHAGHEAEEALLVEAVRGLDLHEARLPFRQRTGLVDDDRVDP